MISLAYYDSPLGRMLLRTEDGSVTGLWFLGQKHFPAELTDTAEANEDADSIRKLKRWLDEYFSGGKPDSSELVLRPEGSEFRRTVWERLCRIPNGETVSYGQIADELEAVTGKRISAQAVGGAVGHNPISLIIPCHRVLSAGGELTGYAGGLEVKAALLELEGISFKKQKPHR